MNHGVHTRTVGPYRVVAVVGEFDVHTATDLRRYFADLIAGGPAHLVIDLDGVGFLDSTGLGVLVGILKMVSTADGSLGIVCARQDLLKILRITGLATVFTLHSTVEAALVAAHARAGAPASS